MSETLKQALDILMAYQSESDDNPMRGRNLHTDNLLDRVAELEAQLAEARAALGGALIGRHNVPEHSPTAAAALGGVDATIGGKPAVADLRESER
jgi:hypothetical protein